MANDDAEAVIRAMDGYQLHGRYIRVNDAHREVSTRNDRDRDFNREKDKDISPRRDRDRDKNMGRNKDYESPKKRQRKEISPPLQEEIGKFLATAEPKIVTSILKHVKYWRILLALSAVNRRLSKLAKDPQLWKALFIERWSQWTDIHSEVLLNSAKLTEDNLPWYSIFRREFMNRNDTIPEKLIPSGREHRLQDYTKRKHSHILIEISNYYEVLQRRDLLEKIKGLDSKHRRDRFLAFIPPEGLRNEDIEGIISHLKDIPVTHEKTSENARLLHQGLVHASGWQQYSVSKIEQILKDAEEELDRFPNLLSDGTVLWQSTLSGYGQDEENSKHDNSAGDNYLFLVIMDSSLVLACVTWVSKKASK